MAKIWLIGGTRESADLAQAIAAAHLACVVSVTTESARSLYPLAPELQIWVGRLNPTSIAQFLQEQGISAILDASHPFAVEISRMAIAVATQHKIPYLRFERPTIASQGEDGILYLDSLETLLAGNYLHNQRVLLTLGYRFLSQFQSWQHRAVLFARILPSLPAIEAALQAGFPPDRLIALRPPISLELERALWQQWHISLVVTKASGIAGGEDTKQKVAQELGVSLMVIDRPVIPYPQQTSEVAIALAFCCTHA